MPFFLPRNALFNLSTIRAEYQTKKNINIDRVPSLSIPSSLFWSVDVTNRKAQIEFLEKWLFVLKPNTFKEEDITNEEEWGAHVTASRIMVAVALCIQSQIRKVNRHSELSELINEKLGIASNNLMDKEDKEVCLFGAKRLVESKDAFNEANAALTTAKRKPFTPREWDKFTTYLRERTNEKPAHDPYADYPITNISQKLFGEVFAFAGVTAAIITTDALRKSTNGYSNRLKLGVLVGSTLIVCTVFGPSGAQYAPIVTDGLIAAVGYIGLSAIFSKGMRVVGQGVGFTVGYPLDLTCQLLYTTCKTVGVYCYPLEKNHITGMRIADGCPVSEGMVLIPANKLPTEYQTVNVDIRDGQIFINGEQAPVTEAGIELSSGIIDHITKKGIIYDSDSKENEIEIGTEGHFL
jgi:hypothetical protein